MISYSVIKVLLMDVIFNKKSAKNRKQLFYFLCAEYFSTKKSSPLRIAGIVDGK